MDALLERLQPALQDPLVLPIVSGVAALAFAVVTFYVASSWLQADEKAAAHDDAVGTVYDHGVRRSTRRAQRAMPACPAAWAPPRAPAHTPTPRPGTRAHKKPAAYEPEVASPAVKTPRAPVRCAGPPQGGWVRCARPPAVAAIQGGRRAGGSELRRSSGASWPPQLSRRALEQRDVGRASPPAVRVLRCATPPP